MGIGWRPGADGFGPDVIVSEPTERAKRITTTPRPAVEIPSEDRPLGPARVRFRPADLAG